MYRLPYLGRVLLLIFSTSLVAAMISPLLSPDARILLLIAFVLIVVPVKIFAFDVARIRNIGWSPWLLLLLLIPGIGSIMQILLFVMPPGSHVEIAE